LEAFAPDLLDSRASRFAFLRACFPAFFSARRATSASYRCSRAFRTKGSEKKSKHVEDGTYQTSDQVLFRAPSWMWSPLRLAVDWSGSVQPTLLVASGDKEWPIPLTRIATRFRWPLAIRLSKGCIFRATLRGRKFRFAILVCHSVWGSSSRSTLTARTWRLVCIGGPHRAGADCCRFISDEA
jgi:hypothetical protein